MARLSISDLNDLSGVSNNDMEEILKDFKNAHTHLFKRMIGWINVYEAFIIDLKKKEERADDDIVLYRISKSMYYEASLMLDDVDLFDEYTSEYVAVLNKLRLNEVVSEVMKLQSVLRVKKKDIIQRMSKCYGMFSEAYKRLEEDYE